MPERPGHLAGGGIPKLRPSRQAHERDLVLREPGDLGEPLRVLGAVGVQPRKRQAVAARELDEPSRRLGRMRPDDLDTDTVPRLKALPARHERPEQQVAERAVLEQERSQLLALDGDVAKRLGHHGRQEHRLPREQVRLSEEAARAVAVDLRAGLVEDGRLAFDDRDQGIASITDPKEHVTDLRAPLLAVLGELGELPLGKHGRPGCHARTLFPTLRAGERRGDCIAVSSPDARLTRADAPGFALCFAPGWRAAFFRRVADGLEAQGRLVSEHRPDDRHAPFRQPPGRDRQVS